MEMEAIKMTLKTTRSLLLSALLAFVLCAITACDNLPSNVAYTGAPPTILHQSYGCTVNCLGCHETTVLAGTTNECVGCHVEPEIHLGRFGQDCGRCHTATAWRPAQLSQHTFPLNHGDEGKIDCQTCHELTYATYTCTNCHAHEPAETVAEHAEKELFDITDCATCHPNGLGDEAKEADGDD